MPATSTGQVILAIDQGTTNSKAALISADGVWSQVVRLESGLPHPTLDGSNRTQSASGRACSRRWRTAWKGQPLEEHPTRRSRAWRSRLSASPWSVGGPAAGTPLGPVIGWQDRRTAAWCSQSVTDQDRQLVSARTGLRVDPMFSAPKMRWLLDNARNGVPIEDVRLGTIDSWLVWQLTGGAEHLCEAGNASRTLLYDITALDWNADLLEIFGVPAADVAAPRWPPTKASAPRAGSHWCPTAHRLLP